MNTMPSTRAKRHTPRSVSSSLTTIGALAFLFLAVILAALVAAAYPALEKLWPLAVDIGRALRPHIGWGLSILIAVLIALYVAVLGGGRIAKIPEFEKTLRLIGLTSEITAAMSVPPVVFVSLSFLSDPHEIGALLIIIPVEILLVLLASQLGKFEVLPDAEALRAAKRELMWASEQREKLQNYSLTSMRAVSTAASGIFLFPPAAGITFVTVAYGTLEDNPLREVSATVIFAIFALIVLLSTYTSGLIFGIHVERKVSGYTWASWALSASVAVAYLVCSFVFIDFLEHTTTIISQGLALSIGIVTFSWILPVRWRWTRWGSLRWLAIQTSIRSLEPQMAKGRKRIATLEPLHGFARLRSFLKRKTNSSQAR